MELAKVRHLTAVGGGERASPFFYCEVVSVEDGERSPLPPCLLTSEAVRRDESGVMRVGELALPLTSYRI